MREEDWMEFPEKGTDAHRLIWSSPAGSGKVIEPYSWAADLNW